jgi:hypothetical protein
MKTSPRFGRIALTSALVGALVTVAAQAQTSLSFYAFETGGVSNPDDLNAISLAGLLQSESGGVSIRISNQSAVGDNWITSTRPTITKIFFENNGSLSSSILVTASGGVSLTRNDSLNLPGGNTVNFVVDSAYGATPPPVRNGIDPGEFAIFLFQGSEYDAVLNGLAAGTIRIGMHVQEIGANGEDSAAYLNIAPNGGDVIPEPTAALLGGLGVLLLLRRKR